MEMGGDPEREAPFFFAKPADAVVPCGISNNNTSAGDVVTNLANLTQIEYPLATTNLHHEIELVVAIGSKNDSQIAPVDAEKYIYGYAVGVDLTRRDLQTIAKASGRPWCTAKGFDQSAPIGDIYPVDSCHSLSKQLLRSQEDCSQSAELWLNVNGQRRQTGYPSKEMIWSVGEIIAILSQQFELRPGDLIFTGTPAGVTALQPGDHVTAGMTGLGELTFTVTPTFTSKAS